MTNCLELMHEYDPSPMNTNEFHPAFKAMFFLAAVFGGTAFACLFAIEPSNRMMILIARGAAIILKVRGLRWAQSILAGVLIVITYFALYTFILALIPS